MPKESAASDAHETLIEFREFRGEVKGTLLEMRDFRTTAKLWGSILGAVATATMGFVLWTVNSVYSLKSVTDKTADSIAQSELQMKAIRAELSTAEKESIVGTASLNGKIDLVKQAADLTTKAATDAIAANKEIDMKLAAAATKLDLLSREIDRLRTASDEVKAVAGKLQSVADTMSTKRSGASVIPQNRGPTPTRSTGSSSRPVAPNTAPLANFNGRFIPSLSSVPLQYAVSAANSLQSKPYLWQGKGSEDSAYDCSSSISYTLMKAGLLHKNGGVPIPWALASTPAPAPPPIPAPTRGPAMTPAPAPAPAKDP